MSEALQSVDEAEMPPFPDDVTQNASAPTVAETDPSTYTTAQGEDVREMELSDIGTRLETLQAYAREIYADIDFYKAEIEHRSDDRNKAKILPDAQFDIKIERGVKWSAGPAGCVEFIRECRKLGVPREEIKVAVSIKGVYATKKASADALAKRYGGELADIVKRAFESKDEKPRITCVRKTNA